jgi:hypothetical protein
MALTEEEKDFAREQIQSYKNMINHFQDQINFLEEKIAGKYTLVGSDLVVGVTENVSNYTGDKSKGGSNA